MLLIIHVLSSLELNSEVSESQGGPASATQGGRGASYLTESQFTPL